MGWIKVIVYDEVQFSLHQSEVNPDALNLSKAQRAAGFHRTDRQTERTLANRLLMKMQVRDGRGKQAAGTCDCESRQKLFPD